MTGPTTLLAVAALDARYGEAAVHHPVSFDLCRGDVVCLRGPNGVGKTTALLGLAGGVRQHAGVVRLHGEVLPVAGRCGPGRFAVALQRQPVFSELTVREHLRLAAAIGGSSSDEPLDEELFALLTRRETFARRAGECSGGEQRLVGLACAALRRPAVLLLDEPLAGLAPALRPALHTWIEKLRSDGLGIVLVEHDPSFQFEGASEVQVWAAASNP